MHKSRESIDEQQAAQMESKPKRPRIKRVPSLVKNSKKMSRPIYKEAWELEVSTKDLRKLFESNFGKLTFNRPDYVILKIRINDKKNRCGTIDVLENSDYYTMFHYIEEDEKYIVFFDHKKKCLFTATCSDQKEIDTIKERAKKAALPEIKKYLLKEEKQ